MSRQHTYIVTSLFFLIALVFCFVVFGRLEKEEFLLVGDQNFFTNFDNVKSFSFYLRRLDNLGVHNGWQFLVRFWDIIYFLSVYKLGINFIWAENVQLFIVTFMVLSLAYYGLRQLVRLLNIQAPLLVLITITLWYTFNPYTLALWHGGVLNVGAGITYSLAPLLFYYLNKIVLFNGDKNDAIILSLLLLVSSFVFWMFAPLLIVMLLYIAILLAFKKTDFSRLRLGVLSTFALTTLLLHVFTLFCLFFEFTNLVGYRDPFASPAFGNQQGGIGYQLLMYFSWGIYTEWLPRTLYPFAKYFFSAPYIIGTVGIYTLILCGAFLIYLEAKKSKTKEIFTHLSILLILLGVSLFLGKGAQPPLGEIFVFLYNEVPIFRVFRTPDIRFGFTTVFLISLLLLYASTKIPKKAFSLILLICIFLQSWFLLNGEAILGKNVPGKYFDRIVYLNNEQKELISYLNQHASQTEFTLAYPPYAYGQFIAGGDEVFVSSDVIPKFVQSAFIYPDTSPTDLANVSRTNLTTIIGAGNLIALRDYPIVHILLRKDVVCKDCVGIKAEDLGKEFTLALENKYYSLYKIDSGANIIMGDVSTFEYVNPTKLEIVPSARSNDINISLLLSKDQGWKVFKKKPFDLLYLIAKPLGERTNIEKYAYGNSWRIRPEAVVGEDELVLFYHPQAIFKLTLYISFGTGLVALSYLFLTRRKHVQSV